MGVCLLDETGEGKENSKHKRALCEVTKEPKAVTLLEHKKSLY